MIVQLVHKKGFRFHSVKFVRLAFLSLTLGFLAPVACTQDENRRLAPKERPILVAGAASLTDVLDELSQRWIDQNRGSGVRLSFGASNLLARQIIEGAHVDIFFSADPESMGRLRKKGLIREGLESAVVSNRLVVITPADSNVELESPMDFLGNDIRRVALCDSEVPVGRYTRRYLEAFGLYEKVLGRSVQFENVRATLAAVEGGNADLGIVYATDASGSQRVRVAYVPPFHDQPRIVYPCAIIDSERSLEQTEKLFQFLVSPEAKDAFEEHGFYWLDASARSTSRKTAP